MRIFMNGGSFTTSTKVWLKYHDNVWLYDQSITNNISMHNAHKHGYEILYDNIVEDVFIITKWNGEKIKFILIKDVLYYHGMR